MPKAEQISAHDELLREIGWVRVALQDLQDAVDVTTEKSDLGEVREEPKDLVQRMGIVKSRVAILVKVSKMYLRAVRNHHNRMVELKTRAVESKLGGPPPKIQKRWLRDYGTPPTADAEPTEPPNAVG